MDSDWNLNLEFVPLDTSADDIKVSVARLDALIDQLQRQRVRLLEKLNVVQATTRVIPFETLSLILQYTTPQSRTFRDSYTVYSHTNIPVLRLVSSLWRNVVDSTPSLWNSVDLSMTRGSGQRLRESRIKYLEACLRNSGDLPFDLSLSFDPGDCGPGLVSPEIDDVIESKAPQFRQVVVTNAPRAWVSFLPQMTSIASLRLRAPSGITGQTIELALPDSRNLHHLWLDIDIAPFAFVFPSSPLSSITHLHITSAQVHLNVLLLFTCPNLVKLSCLRPPCLNVTPFELDMRNLPTAPVVFKHLQILEWDIPEDALSPWNTAVLQYLHAPALVELRWGELDLSGASHSPLAVSFFSRLPSSLARLTLSGMSDSSSAEEYLDCIPDATNLVSIQLKSCADSLIPTILDRCGESFPALNAFLFHYNWNNDSFALDDSIGLKLVSALKRQFSNGRREFSFDVDKRIDWESSWEDLRELAKDGFRLNLKCDGELPEDVWPWAQSSEMEDSSWYRRHRQFRVERLRDFSLREWLLVGGIGPDRQRARSTKD